MKRTKTNKNKQKKNVRKVKCGISGTIIPESQAKCGSVKNNNTQYYSAEYENIFNNTNISDKLQNVLLTCVMIGGTLKTADTILVNYKHKQAEQNYRIYFDNDIVLICDGTNAEVKKYFTQLKTYKQAVKKVSYIDYYGIEKQVENINDYAPYIRQKHLFDIRISYNPDTKNSTIKEW